MNKITETLISTLTAEDGSFDYAQFKEIMNELSKFRIEHKAESDKALKDKKDADEANAKVYGEAYYKSLKAGDKISWNSADGVKTGVVAVMKAGAKNAHVVLDGLPARDSVEDGYKGKFGDRYPTWDKIVVPADFELPVKEEEVA